MRQTASRKNTKVVPTSTATLPAALKMASPNLNIIPKSSWKLVSTASGAPAKASARGTSIITCLKRTAAWEMGNSLTAVWIPLGSMLMGTQMPVRKPESVPMTVLATAKALGVLMKETRKEMKAPLVTEESTRSEERRVGKGWRWRGG